MSFLEINGYDVPVACNQMTRTSFEVMSRFGRTYTGGIDRSRHSEKKAWSFSTPPVAEATAEMLEGLLMGRGVHLAFDSDLYDAKKGIGPNAGYAGTLSAASPKIGTRSLAVTSGATGGVWALGYTADWTVMGWQFHDASWEHFAVVYDADAGSYIEYLAGAVSTSIHDTWRALIADGSLTLVGKALNDNNAEAVKYDDIVAVPFKLDATTITWHYNSGTGRAFSDLPFLSATGDFLKSSTAISVACLVSDEEYRQTKAAATYRVLRVDMQEA